MSSATDTTVTVTFDPTAINKQADVIFPVSKTKAGVMTPALLEQLQESLAVDNFTIYVDVATGNDNNDGSIGAPLATMDAAFEKCPTLWKKTAVIQVATGTYPFVGNPIWLGTGVGPLASPLQVLGTPIDSGLGTMTVDGGSTSTSVIATTAATVDGAYRGAFLRNTTTGGRILITDNTFAAGQTTFSVLKNGGSFSVTPGNTFIVEVPGTIFEAPAFGPCDFHATGEVGCGFRDIKFTANPGSFLGFIPIAIFVGFNFSEGMQFDGGAAGRPVVMFHGSRFNGDSEPFYWPAALVNPYSLDRQFAGAYLLNSAWAMFDRCSLSLNFVSDGTVFNCQINNNIGVDSLDMRTSILFGENQSSIFLTRGNIDSALPFGPGALTFAFQTNASLGDDPTESLDISNSSASGVSADANSFVEVGNVTGTGNAGAGLATIRTSQMVTQQLGGTTTVTGTAGDVLVGAVPKAYGALPFSEVDGSGPTLNRVE